MLTLETYQPANIQNVQGPKFAKPKVDSLFTEPEQVFYYVHDNVPYLFVVRANQ